MKMKNIQVKMTIKKDYLNKNGEINILICINLLGVYHIIIFLSLYFK